MYDAQNLDVLVVIRARYRDCEFGIYDFEDMRPLSQSDIADAVRKSRDVWKAMMSGTPPSSESEECVKVKRPEKQPKDLVLCVETGAVYGSLRECSDSTRLPYTTIANCIKRGNATRGLHFMYIKQEDVRNVHR